MVCHENFDFKDEPTVGAVAVSNQANVSNPGKCPQNSATSPGSEKKIRARPLAQPTIQGNNQSESECGKHMCSTTVLKENIEKTYKSTIFRVSHP